MPEYQAMLVDKILGDKLGKETRPILFFKSSAVYNLCNSIE